MSNYFWLLLIQRKDIRKVDGGESSFVLSKFPGLEKKSLRRGSSRPASTNSVCNSRAVKVNFSLNNLDATESHERSWVSLQDGLGVGGSSTSLSRKSSSSLRKGFVFVFVSSAMFLSRDQYFRIATGLYHCFNESTAQLYIGVNQSVYPPPTHTLPAASQGRSLGKGASLKTL